MLTVTGGSHATATALPGFLNNGVVNIGQGATLLSAASFTQITGQTTVDAASGLPDAVSSILLAARSTATEERWRQRC